MPVECVCGVCGKHFTIPPSAKRKGEGKYCSPKCAYEARRAERLSFVCERCGKTFYLTPGVAAKRIRDNGRITFCSRRCQLYRYNSLEERLWSRVVKSHDPNGCWEWTGTTNRSGYGLLRIPGRRSMVAAHRLAWELTYGPIPQSDDPKQELCVLHRCDNPKCVNPSHLFLGTRLDNNADKMAKGRHRALAGDASPRHSLTFEKVRLIRQLYQAGMNRNQIAKMFGVSWTCINYVVSGRTWRHAA